MDQIKLFYNSLQFSSSMKFLDDDFSAQINGVSFTKSSVQQFYKQSPSFKVFTITSNGNSLFSITGQLKIENTCSSFFDSFYIDSGKILLFISEQRLAPVEPVRKEREKPKEVSVPQRPKFLPQTSVKSTTKQNIDIEIQELANQDEKPNRDRQQRQNSQGKGSYQKQPQYSNAGEQINIVVDDKPRQENQQSQQVRTQEYHNQKRFPSNYKHDDNRRKQYDRNDDRADAGKMFRESRGK